MESQAAIKVLLDSYQEALNASDVSKAISVYSEDGTVMPTGAPSAQGREALGATYSFIFSQIQLDIVFTIHSLQVSGELAFAHTSSKGTVLVHQTGDRMPEENRELFVFIKEQGEWKVQYYMFNKAK